MLLNIQETALYSAIKDNALTGITTSPSDDIIQRSFAPSVSVWGMSVGDGAAATNLYTELQSNFVSVGTRPKQILVFNGALPESFFQSIGLDGYRCAPVCLGLLQDLNEALNFLRMTGKNFENDVLDSIYSVIFVERTHDSYKKQLTGLTVPPFPLTSFFSENALHHLAPAAISERRDIAILAENLLHESVHQRMNLTILERPVFRDSFDSAQAPRAAVPWHSDSADERDRHWETDRCLHAFSVYVRLCTFRRYCVSNMSLHPETQRVFEQAIDQSRVPLSYLSSHLDTVRDQLADYGNELLSSLQFDARQHLLTP